MALNWKKEVKIGPVKTPLFVPVFLLLIAVAIIGTGTKIPGLSFGILGYSNVNLGTNANNVPVMLITVNPSGYSESFTTIPAGTSLNSNIVTQLPITIGAAYSPTVANIQFNNTQAQQITCAALVPFNLNAPLNLTAAYYSSTGNPILTQTAKFDLAVGNQPSSTYNVSISGTSGPVQLGSSGVFVIPQSQQNQLNPTLVFAGTTIITNTNTGQSYIITNQQWQGILNSNGYTTSQQQVGVAQTGSFIGILSSAACGLGGPSGEQNIIWNEVAQASTQAAQTTGGFLNPLTLTYNANTGIATETASNAVINQFQLQIPSTINAQLLWGPNYGIPQIQSFAVGTISAQTPVTYTVCNNAPYSATLNAAFSSTGGIVLTPQTTAITLGANSCSSGTAIASAQANSLSGWLTLTVTSGTNSVTTSIPFQTGSMAQNVGVQAQNTTPGQLVPTQNATGTSLSCTPIVMKVKTATTYTGGFLGLFAQPSTVNTCVYDYTAVGAIVFVIGLAFYVAADRGKKKFTWIFGLIALFGLVFVLLSAANLV